MKTILSFVLGMLMIAGTVATANAATGAQSTTRKATTTSQEQDLSEFDHVDPKKIVPDRPLRQALTYYQQYRKYFPNHEYVVVVDYSKHSSKERMYVINMKSGEVTSFLTSHGRGSDQNNSGYARSFSNKKESYQTSLGIYRTAETYNGKHGFSLRLDGLSPTNNNARQRAIVIHGAKYVSENSSRAGRSQGCPAMDKKYSTPVIQKIKHGTLLYAWAG